ncbi:hypothetical protein GYA93_20905 [Gordonia desulfuricans]|uniref:Uncharacterized protein n=1 Tax=Gordonia desulfuricans TaxID=89051 RepID=A0A7K3LUX8_9ACTN|nr:hypothetical protein [Gordonia desulfuricans]NDK92009.1 hypothetical protein [Gordonia desulfuricans]
MKITKSIKNRTIAGLAGVGVAAGLALGGAGLASAGTMPVTHPGEPTIAMTITNHTDQTERLAGATPGTGQWVQAPRTTLAPGASETVTTVAPNSSYETVFVNYRIGALGPRATYNVEDVQGDVNTAMTGISGGGHYMINAPQIDSGYPNVTVSYDLW